MGGTKLINEVIRAGAIDPINYIILQFATANRVESTLVIEVITSR